MYLYVKSEQYAFSNVLRPLVGSKRRGEAEIRAVKFCNNWVGKTLVQVSTHVLTLYFTPIKPQLSTHSSLLPYTLILMNMLS